MHFLKKEFLREEKKISKKKREREIVSKFQNFKFFTYPNFEKRRKSLKRDKKKIMFQTKKKTFFIFFYFLRDVRVRKIERSKIVILNKLDFCLHCTNV